MPVCVSLPNEESPPMEKFFFFSFFFLKKGQKHKVQTTVRARAYFSGQSITVFSVDLNLCCSWLKHFSWKKKMLFLLVHTHHLKCKVGISCLHLDLTGCINKYMWNNMLEICPSRTRTVCGSIFKYHTKRHSKTKSKRWKICMFMCFTLLQHQLNEACL